MDSYKVKRIREMLDYSERTGFGAKLTIFSEKVAPISIDAEGLKVLMKYYEGKDDER